MARAPASIPLASSARNVPRRASSAPEDTVRGPAEDGEGETHETVAGARRPNRTCQARRPTVNLADRAIPEPNSGCLIWLGATSRGYGYVSVNGKMRPAHVVNYEEEKGPVPPGLELDHKCRVRCCINENHLEPVTPLVNRSRGLLAALDKKRRAITHCPHGHEYTPSNTLVYKSGRQCKACAAERMRKRRAACRSWA